MQCAGNKVDLIKINSGLFLILGRFNYIYEWIQCQILIYCNKNKKYTNVCVTVNDRNW